VNGNGVEAVPAGLVTVIGPLVASLGTFTRSWVSETPTSVASTPSNVTDCTPLKPVPVMVTRVPSGPMSGSKLATTMDAEAASSIGALVILDRSERWMIQSRTVPHDAFGWKTEQ